MSICVQYNEREVTRPAIQELVSRWKLPFYETSAKKNWHVNDVFEDLTRQMRKRYPNELQKRNKKKDKKAKCKVATRMLPVDLLLVVKNM